METKTNEAETEWSRRMRAMLAELETPVRVDRGPDWLWDIPLPKPRDRGIVGEDGEIYLPKWRGSEDE